MKINPRKQTSGATLIRRTLKISGSKVISVEPGPVISRKPMIITTRSQQDEVRFIKGKVLFVHIEKKN